MLLQTANFLDNRMNPLLVRELRQLVRNRFIIVMLILYLGLLSLVGSVIVIFGSFSRSGAEEEIGNSLFHAVTGIMCFTALLIVSMYTALMTSMERINNDLMFTSSLRSSRIIWGKFLSALILSILLFSVTMPFLVLAFILRGVDPAFAVLLIATYFLGVHVFNSFVILVFSAVRTYVQLIFCGGIMLFGMFWFFWAMMVAVYEIAQSGAFGMIGWWEYMVLLLFFSCCFIYLVLTIAVVNVSPPTMNRMVPFRIAISVWFLVSFVFTWFFIGVVPDFWKGWLVFQLVVLGALIVIAVSERESIGLRLKRMLPRNPLLRILVLPFFTGTMSALVWIFFLSCFTFAAYLHFEPDAFSAFENGTLLEREEFKVASTLLMFVFAYSATAMLIRMYLIGSTFSSEKTAALLIAMVPTIAIGSMLVYYISISEIQTHDFFSEYSESYIAAANPFVCIMNAGFSNDRFDKQFYCALFWSIACVILLAPWFFTQLLGFSPKKEGEAMSYEDAVQCTGHMVK